MERPDTGKEIKEVEKQRQKTKKRQRKEKETRVMFIQSDWKNSQWLTARATKKQRIILSYMYMYILLAIRNSDGGI